MSDLLNKYAELHDQYIGLLVELYKTEQWWLERQSPHRTLELRKVMKQMRLTLKEMERTAQARMQERRVEWNSDKFKTKERQNERNFRSDNGCSNSVES